MSLNLHAIVRGAISSVNADEQVYLLQSTGNTNVSGRIVATYAGPQLVGAQVQTLSNDDLKIVSELLGHSDVSTTANVYADVLKSSKAKVADLISLKLNGN